MKKILLMSAVMLIASAAASATTVAKNLPKLRPSQGAFKTHASVKAYDGMTSKKIDSQTRQLFQKVNAPMKAKDNVELAKTYAPYTYVYSNVLGGTLLKAMYGDAYLGFADGKVYVTPFGSESTIMVGTEDNTVENKWAEQGGKPYTFDLSGIKIEGEDANYVMLPGVSDEEGNISRATSTKVTGYYFAEDDEFYLESFVGIWPETVTEADAPVYGVEELDIVTQDNFNESIFKGTYERTTAFDENATGEVNAYVSMNFVNVKGFVPYEEDEWVLFLLNDDGSASVPAYQMIQEGTYYTDESHQDTYDAIEFTMGIGLNGNSITYPNEDYSSSYFVNVNEDQSFSIVNDGLALFALFTLANPQEYSAWYGDLILKNLTINVSTETVANSINNTLWDKTTNNAVFDLQGRKIDGKNLQKGLYIINNKKVVLK